MLLLNEKDIRAVFTMEDAIESNIEAYKIFSSGNAVVPLREAISHSCLLTAPSWGRPGSR